MTQLNVGTNLHGAHDSAGEREESAGDLGDALTYTLLDVRQVGPCERWRRRW